MPAVYASLKPRLAAALYDYIVIAIYLVLLTLVSLLLRPRLVPLFTGSPAVAETTGFLALTLPVALYFIVSECSRGQGTWGKRKTGLHVRSDGDGGRIGIGRALARNAVKFLPWELAHYTIWRFQFPDRYPSAYLSVMLCIVYALILAYFLCPLFNKRRKSVYDWIAGTSVVRVGRDD